MSWRRLRQASSEAAKSGLSAKSMIKAKSIAASILNMSENDLADMMETDQVSPRNSNASYSLTKRLYVVEMVYKALYVQLWKH